MFLFTLMSLFSHLYMHTAGPVLNFWWKTSTEKKNEFLKTISKIAHSFFYFIVCTWFHVETGNRVIYRKIASILLMSMEAMYWLLTSCQSFVIIIITFYYILFTIPKVCWFFIFFLSLCAQCYQYLPNIWYSSLMLRFYIFLLLAFAIIAIPNYN